MELEPSTYFIGYTARIKGARQEDNPFPAVGHWHRDWRNGWMHADEEFQKKRVRIIPIKLIKT